MAKSYTVIYKTGGTECYQWHKIYTSFATVESAIEKRKELERMGYESLIHDTMLLNAIGMPEDKK
jgi:hypothetical protein